MSFKIKNIKAREIVNSKGEMTVEVELKTDFGSVLASTPSGTSKGQHEALELENTKKAVRNVNEIIAPELCGKDVRNQKEIDSLLIDLDGTENKSRLGVNAILPSSIAVCRAGAQADKLSLFRYIAKISNLTIKLPDPSFLLIEGGMHAGNNLSVQEFMISPEGSSFREKLEIGAEIYHALGDLLSKKYGKSAINVGLEGGFAVPSLNNTKEVLDIILKASKGKNIRIILDVAASSFFKNGIYQFEGKAMDREDLLNFYQELLNTYPIFGIEDPFAEDDWEGFQLMTEKFGKNLLIIGDDLLVTNLKRIKIAQEKKACNAMILKPNQIGTVTETIQAAKMAKSFQWNTIVSHRSEDTRDDFIADFAAGTLADFIKAGALARGERVAKYNRLLRIEEEIN